jgi:hypothetical protein
VGAFSTLEKLEQNLGQRLEKNWSGNAMDSFILCEIDETAVPSPQFAEIGGRKPIQSTQLQEAN